LIKLILLDCDGVMTDGTMPRRFHVRDGLAIIGAKELGLKVGIITGRLSDELKQRCEELGILPEEVFVSSFEKGSALIHACEQFDVSPDDTVYIGDDLPDIPALKAVGHPMCPFDAVKEVWTVCQDSSDGRYFWLANKGGSGAIREAIERVLKLNEEFDDFVKRYSNEFVAAK
jgi:3-deoxy-D-manno-octulosonate 8-phosphate phosphatase (KDO 8-P phosphatase)